LLNQIEKALMHALFVHLHHNIDKAIDFGAFKRLNDKVDATWPGALLVGPDANDDAAVVKVPGTETVIASKLESHCSPCVPRPYDSAATGAGGAMRDVVAMGARPIFILDFIGTRPLEEKVLVGPCGFEGTCKCGQCVEMTSQDRLNLMLQGVRDMADAMDVFVAGGGFSTSFSDIVPAVVISVVGKQITKEPLTKPAKAAGDIIIIAGKTSNDGNDSLYRAGMVSEMRPAIALFAEERAVMEASLAAMRTGKIKACSDLGAAGIGAAVCESARFGGLGARVDLARVPLRVDDITPEEILICETQGRMLFQVAPVDVEEVLAALASENVPAAAIGEITDTKEAVFTFGDQPIATIPNQPTDEQMQMLKA